MTKFDISSNNLKAEGGKALAAGLKGNQVITELNISSNFLVINSDYGNDTSGVIAIVDAISDMGALTSLNMSANGLKGAEAGKALGDAIAANTVLKELDISGSEYDSRKCDVEFVQTFAVGLRDNGAMTRLNLSDNGIGGHDDEPGVHALADMLKSNTTLIEFNISSNSLDEECAQILAPAIKDNGAMTSLNLSDNELGAEGAKHIAAGIKVTKCAVVVVLAPFSCLLTTG
jgi:Ran GTPase-activating protein (RanGAP) involved in mRNA processing and transport